MSFVVTSAGLIGSHLRYRRGAQGVSGGRGILVRRERVMDLRRKTEPKEGPFEVECVCGEKLTGQTDEALYDLFQMHVKQIHPPLPQQWSEAAARIERAKEAKSAPSAVRN